MLLIPRPTSIAHLEENLAAIDVELDEDDLAERETMEQIGHPLG
jgi:aryl-alcohol dehydrogenase-like predicted oxidoreductase